MASRVAHRRAAPDLNRRAANISAQDSYGTAANGDRKPTPAKLSDDADSARREPDAMQLSGIYLIVAVPYGRGIFVLVARDFGQLKCWRIRRPIKHCHEVIEEAHLS